MNEMETSTNNTKRMKMNKQEVVFNVWFLSKLLDYLDFIEIARMDTAICNKSYRVNWLECIAKDMGSVSTKVQIGCRGNSDLCHSVSSLSPAHFLHNSGISCNESIEWCSNRKVRFKFMFINNMIRLNITTKAASLLSMC